MTRELHFVKITNYLTIIERFKNGLVMFYTERDVTKNVYGFVNYSLLG